MADIGTQVRLGKRMRLVLTLLRKRNGITWHEMSRKGVTSALIEEMDRRGWVDVVGRDPQNPRIYLTPDGLDKVWEE